MFFHILLNQLKILLRNKETVFWVLSFPIILGILFNFAFSNLNSAFVFKTIDISVVNDTDYKNKQELVSSIDTLSKGGESQVFNTTFVEDESQADKLLSDKAIDGYIKVQNGDVKVIVKSSGINQTIIKSVIDQTIQMNSSLSDAAKANPNVLNSEVLANISNTAKYFKDTTNESTDRTVLFFYTLIGMACLYAGIFGIITVNQNEANLSTLGARLSVSPASRFTTLTAGLVAGYIVSYIGVIFLYLFLTLILKINFGESSWAILLTMAFGSLAGITLGTFVGVCNKQSENIKTGILSGVTMLFSFLAGMMGTTSIKHLIDLYVPVLSFINPVNLISDSLFSIYYFGVGSRYWTNIIGLSVFIIASILLSWAFLRKKKYASL